MKTRRILLTTAGVVALAASLVGTAAAQRAAGGLQASVMPPQKLEIAIRPASGMSHGEHVLPVHFAVEPGLPTHVTFVNYTRTFHTFTAPGLGVTALIRPAHGATPTRTTVTFTARDFGVFDWACVLCPADGAPGTAMHGKIYSIMHV